MAEQEPFTAKSAKEFAKIAEESRVGIGVIPSDLLLLRSAIGRPGRTLQS